MKKLLVSDYDQTFYLNDEDIEIKKGDRIGQAIFTPYLVADTDTANGERNGGFGSTN